MVLAAEGKIGMSFGTRRAHPALAAMIERSSFIGGIDSVSNVLGAKLLKTEASGTMPHAFIICVGDEVRAWQIFNSAISEKSSADRAHRHLQRRKNGRDQSLGNVWARIFMAYAWTRRLRAEEI